MSPELKSAWIEALRSGRYEQGQKHLMANGKYCCLGVLCEVVPQEIYDHNGYLRTEHNGQLIITTTDDEGVDESTLESECLSDIGLHDTLGLPLIAQTELIRMNDGDVLANELVAPKSFSEIADWIETYL